jgi:DNA-binding NarL/FixJ family response regulator
MTKVIIADDHRMFREALTSILTMGNIAEVVGEVSNGEDLLKVLETKSPDLVLMDISMPGMGGVEATRKAIELNADLKVLTLSGYDDEKYYFSMVDAGAKGFVLKNAGINELQSAIKEVMSNGSWFSSDLLQNIIRKLNKTPKKSELPDLSEREQEILKLICDSLTNEEIAKRINLSYDTVKWHRANILSKTGCSNAAGLVIYAIKNNYIQI